VSLFYHRISYKFKVSHSLNSSSLCWSARRIKRADEWLYVITVLMNSARNDLAINWRHCLSVYDCSHSIDLLVSIKRRTLWYLSSRRRTAATDAACVRVEPGDYWQVMWSIRHAGANYFLLPSVLYTDRHASCKSMAPAAVHATMTLWRIRILSTLCSKKTCDHIFDDKLK